MDHYYSKNPASENRPGRISFDIMDEIISFNTGTGVFSGKRVDYGTQLLIEAILDETREGGSLKFLDIGCGYGPLGITMARFSPGFEVHMTDVNQRALELSAENTRLNRLDNVKVYESDLYGSIHETFDIIATNPPIRAGKLVVYGIFEGAYERLAPGGMFYCVIQKKQGAESAEKKLASIFGNCICINKGAGFRVMKSVKKSD
jgi:16S rRNA (guanine1207-N2)-methyltransferase